MMIPKAWNQPLLTTGKRFAEHNGELMRMENLFILHKFFFLSTFWFNSMKMLAHPRNCLILSFQKRLTALIDTFRTPAVYIKHVCYCNFTKWVERIALWIYGTPRPVVIDICRPPSGSSDSDNKGFVEVDGCRGLHSLASRFTSVMKWLEDINQNALNEECDPPLHDSLPHCLSLCIRRLSIWIALNPDTLRLHYPFPTFPLSVRADCCSTEITGNYNQRNTR